MVGVILHRFAVLKVQQRTRPEGSELALRLDRRTDPQSSKAELIFSGGMTQAYDRVSKHSFTINAYSRHKSTYVLGKDGGGDINASQ